MVEDTMFSGESKNIEYKVSLPDKSEKYMKTIVAFANTQGGKLIVGVDDKTHQIVGVENDVLFQLMDGIANAVSDSCVPQIIQYTLLTFAGEVPVPPRMARKSRPPPKSNISVEPMRRHSVRLSLVYSVMRRR